MVPQPREQDAPIFKSRSLQKLFVIKIIFMYRITHMHPRVLSVEATSTLPEPVQVRCPAGWERVAVDTRTVFGGVRRSPSGLHAHYLLR